MAPSCLRVQRYDKFFVCANILIKIFKNFSVLYICTIFAPSIVTECSAVGSALRSGRRGRAFESPHSDTAKKSNATKTSFAAFVFFGNNTVIGLWGHFTFAGEPKNTPLKFKFLYIHSG